MAPVVTGMTKRSDQQVALRRRPAQIGWICRLTGATKVLQYPLDDGQILDARDHLELPAAAPADLDVDRKDESLNSLPASLLNLLKAEIIYCAGTRCRSSSSKFCTTIMLGGAWESS
jgi:hypothetical protein